MADDADRNVTEVLADLQRGEPDAVERLFPVVYGELRALAGHYFSARRGGHTLQPTLLADEVFMKLVRKTDVSWESRAHFFAVAAKAMRDLLVDHARSKRARKRGGDRQRIALTAVDADGARVEDGAIDLIDLEDALVQLGRIDPRQERIVELRFFAGLSVAETAHVLGVSERTVLYDWRMARAWLRAQLEDAGA